MQKPPNGIHTCPAHAKCSRYYYYHHCIQGVIIVEQARAARIYAHVAALIIALIAVVV
jgi:hypothetical protein